VYQSGVFWIASRPAAGYRLPFPDSVSHLGDTLGGDGCAHLAGGHDSCCNQLAARARACAIMDGNDFALLGESFEAVPDGVLSFFASRYDTKRFCEAEFCSQSRELLLPTFSHDENDLVNRIG